MGNAEVVAGYVAAFASQDPNLIVSFVTDDFVNEHTAALGGGCIGKQTYRERLPAFLHDFAGVRYEAAAVIAEGDQVAVPYRMTCRYDGHDIDLPGVFVFVMRDGKIAKRTDYWCSLGFLRQTGAG